MQINSIFKITCVLHNKVSKKTLKNVQYLKQSFNFFSIIDVIIFNQIVSKASNNRLYLSIKENFPLL